MHIFRSDRGIGFFVLFMLLAVVMSAIGTRLTGSVQVPIAAAVAFVGILVAMYECSYRLEHSQRSIGLKVAFAGLTALLWYGLWLVFEYVHGDAVQFVPPTVWWFPLLVIALARFWPEHWRVGKLKQ